MKYIVLALLTGSFTLTAFAETKTEEWGGRDLNRYLFALAFPQGSTAIEAAYLKGPGCEAWISRETSILQVFVNRTRFEVTPEAGSTMMQNPPYKVTLITDDAAGTETAVISRKFSRNEKLTITRQSGKVTAYTLEVDGRVESCPGKTN